MDYFTTYANGVGKPVIILNSDKAEEFFNRKCNFDKREIRERIERVSQKMKKQINNK